MTTAIILFAATYVLMISFGKWRTWFALAQLLAQLGAGIGILRKEGHEVANADFFKTGIPFTLSAVVPAYIVLWVLFGV